MPKNVAPKPDLFEQLCQAIQRFGNSVLAWNNYRAENPDAAQEAEAASQRIMDLWRQMRDVLARTPAVTYRDVCDVREDVVRAIHRGAAFSPHEGNGGEGGHGRNRMVGPG